MHSKSEVPKDWEIILKEYSEHPSYLEERMTLTHLFSTGSTRF